MNSCIMMKNVACKNDNHVGEREREKRETKSEQETERRIMNYFFFKKLGVYQEHRNIVRIASRSYN